MILITDVHYFDHGGARAAGVLVEDWCATAPVEELVVEIDEVRPRLQRRSSRA